MDYEELKLPIPYEATYCGDTHSVKTNISKEEEKEREKNIIDINVTERLEEMTKQNEELEIIIADEERKIIDNLKTKSFIAVLAVLGLDFLV